MEKCVIDLASAFTKVNKRYYRNIATGKNGFYLQNTENSFGAELYHQFRNIMEDCFNQSYYSGLILQFDILKNSAGIKPDILLHAGQDNRDDQRMYVEIKSNSDASLDEDLLKLCIAIDPYFNFKNAVIIVLNKNIDNTRNCIRTYFKGHIPHNINRLYLFHSCINKENDSLDFLHRGLSPDRPPTNMKHKR